MKVSQADVVENIADVMYHRFPGTQSTVCCIKMKNGFTAVGHSACVDPAEFDEDLGKSIAYKRAEDDVWKLLGFRMGDRIHAQREG